MKCGKNFELLKQQLELLYQKPSKAYDFAFLRKMSLLIIQLHYEGKKEKEVAAFLEKPLSPYMRNQMCLLLAAQNFSEQHPADSDLALLLSEAAQFGPLFILPLRAKADS